MPGVNCCLCRIPTVFTSFPEKTGSSRLYFFRWSLPCPRRNAPDWGLGWESPSSHFFFSGGNCQSSGIWDWFKLREFKGMRCHSWGFNSRISLWKILGGKNSHSHPKSGYREGRIPEESGGEKSLIPTLIPTGNPASARGESFGNQAGKKNLNSHPKLGPRDWKIPRESALGYHRDAPEFQPQPAENPLGIRLGKKSQFPPKIRPQRAENPLGIFLECRGAGMGNEMGQPLRNPRKNKSQIFPHHGNDPNPKNPFCGDTNPSFPTSRGKGPNNSLDSPKNSSVPAQTPRSEATFPPAESREKVREREK